MIPKTSLSLFYICTTMVLAVTSSAAQEARSIAVDMFKATRNIKTLSYVMTKHERIKNEMMTQKSSIKMQREPLKVYAKQLYPNEGLEVLYRDGDKTALVNPNGFPWFNVRLDPTGSRMTKDQHHTILDSGFDCFIDILESLFVKYDGELDQMAKTNGTIKFNGRECWILEFNNPYFSFIKYSIPYKMSMARLVKTRKINREMVTRNNSKLIKTDEIPAGEYVTIPNDYSPRMILYIDTETKTPMMIKVYDSKGLYEHYEFDQVEINPTFEKNEFDSEFEEYDF